jgi:hypothetical protein
MKPKRIFANVLRVVAVVILFIAMLPLVLNSEKLMKDPHFAAWMGFLLAIGAATAIFALASLISREAIAPPEVTASLQRMQQQLMELDVKLKELDLMNDRAHRAPQPQPQHKDYSQQFQQIAHALEEVRQVSLLPDADRRERLKVHREQRKAIMLKELYGLVPAHDWPRAERLLITLETEYPNDSEVAKGRSYLDHSRKLFQDETMIRSSREIEELVAAASFERALEKVNLLVQGFPTSPEAHTLAARVQKEFDTHQETTVQRMFEEIKHDSERRMWKRALMHAEHLLGRFPTHRYAEAVRMQLATLQENAEIQERQEMEVRIQELIHDRQFDEAIELAEDVVRRYPLSPQAESLEKLLPKIRELAREGLVPTPGTPGEG